ncbi:MAG: Asp-tRNA(Asn)/Glu-tRNA(Gln) amidotransferase subunit GatB [Acidilobaceae archaeon]|nr:Asp-tRNA(Asn)/Glu-tRNA(Gln) amidotransferase subunit GatB [Acidilobaceae archaeon]
MRAKIGLEIHVQMTEAGSKLFCNCKANYRGMEPNTNVCPVCIGLPGALPVVNRKSVELALAASLAFSCSTPEYIVFTRKHYFYPDLPKNYQISMYERAGGVPICRGGRVRYLDIHAWEWKECRLRRINIEEDPGKTVYGEGGILRSAEAYVDYNRSGVPLLEIITEPDLGSAREARQLVEYVLLVLEYLGVTNPRLEGAFRVDANVSVEGGERVEVKNIGSTLDVERAINYEIMRQSAILSSGGKVERETRHWDAERGSTRPLRQKEQEEDYLYFPDPDLPPIFLREMVDRARSLAALNDPSALFAQVVELGVSKEMAWSLVTTRPALELFLQSVKRGADPQLSARLIAVDYKGELREKNRDPYDPSSWPATEYVTELVRLVKEGVYTYDAVKGIVLPKLAENPMVDLKSVLPQRAENLDSIIDEVLKREERAVKDYLSGKAQAMNYLVGAVIKATGKKALDPRAIREAIEKRLGRGS